jgi:hypothetical protein
MYRPLTVDVFRSNLEVLLSDLQVRLPDADVFQRDADIRRVTSKHFRPTPEVTARNAPSGVRRLGIERLHLRFPQIQLPGRHVLLQVRDRRGARDRQHYRRMRQPNWRDVRRHVRVPTTPIEFGSQETRKGKSDQKSSFSDTGWKRRGLRLSGQSCGCLTAGEADDRTFTAAK